MINLNPLSTLLDLPHPDHVLFDKDVRSYVKQYEITVRAYETRYIDSDCHSFWQMRAGLFALLDMGYFYAVRDRLAELRDYVNSLKP